MSICRQVTSEATARSEGTTAFRPSSCSWETRARRHPATKKTRTRRQSGSSGESPPMPVTARALADRATRSRSEPQTTSLCGRPVPPNLHETMQGLHQMDEPAAVMLHEVSQEPSVLTNQPVLHSAPWACWSSKGPRSLPERVRARCLISSKR